MLARILQVVTLVAVAGPALWMWVFWERAPTVAMGGLLVGLSWYAMVLAAEFVLLPWANRHDSVAKASWRQLARAWLDEALLMPLVFCWRQPFRSQVVADSLAGDGRGRRGVVFLHGFMCNRGLWNPWMRELKARGHPFAAINIEPVFGPIEAFVPAVDRAVVEITKASGLAPVLVCHSMGGLVARAWMRAMDADHRVWRVITIGSPHLGTVIGRLSRGIKRLVNARQMAYASNWLVQLDRNETAKRRALFTCFYSNCDNMVLPSSSATLQGADNRLVPGVPHVALAYQERVMRETLGLL